MNLINLRPSLTSSLQQHLKAFREGFRHNVAIVGPQGSGKSTLMQQTLRTASQDLTVVYCHLQRSSIREFLTGFATAIMRGALRATPDASSQSLAQSARAIIPKTVAALGQLEEEAARLHPTEIFVRALDILPILCQERQRPCVLVLDEFLFLEDLGFSQAFQELGKRVMTWPSTLVWVTSSSPWKAREILRERLHLLFGQFELIGLEAVEPEAAIAWMEHEVPATGLAQRQAHMQFLLQWVGHCPWYLGMILRRMREVAHLTPRKGTLGTAFEQALWDLLGSADGVLYQAARARIEHLLTHRHGVLAREALLAIAGGARTTPSIGQPDRGSRRHLPDALQLLLEQDMVQRHGACWIIPDQCLAFWLHVVHGPRLQQGMMDDDLVVRPRFVAALQGAWKVWASAAEQSFVARMHRLLEQFRDETISLDSKTGRLPRFTTVQRQSAPEHATYLIADSHSSRWYYLVGEARVTESQVGAFEAFCKAQSQKPSRKVVMARDGVDLNAKLLAKAANMWVWEPDEVRLLCRLYEQPLIDHLSADHAGPQPRPIDSGHGRGRFARDIAPGESRGPKQSPELAQEIPQALRAAMHRVS